MSAIGSSLLYQSSLTSRFRPKVQPRYPICTPARCFTTPRMFVPVGVIGRRRSYSETPSSFQSTASRTIVR
jgi:hypothetical protein